MKDYLFTMLGIILVGTFFLLTIHECDNGENYRACVGKAANIKDCENLK